MSYQEIYQRLVGKKPAISLNRNNKNLFSSLLGHPSLEYRDIGFYKYQPKQNKKGLPKVQDTGFYKDSRPDSRFPTFHDAGFYKDPGPDPYVQPFKESIRSGIKKVQAVKKVANLPALHKKAFPIESSDSAAGVGTYTQQGTTQLPAGQKLFPYTNQNYLNTNRSPAGVGIALPTVGSGNQYQNTLIRNYGHTPQARQYPYLPNNNIGKPINQGDLQYYRRNQATRLNPFDQGTDQYTAANTYLQQRGAQNQQRYRQGTLYKNAPTNVKMPDIIPAPQRAQLERAGKLMVQNKRPSYSQQLYS